MKRRDVIALIAIIFAATPALAQERTKGARVGYLGPGP